MTTYVEIDSDRWHFEPRVAAVFSWRDHVLLQQAIDGDLWALPGGRLLPLELSAEAIVRTMRWEIGQSVVVGRLLWVMELVTEIGGRPFHQLGFYYAADLPAGSPFHDLGRDHAGVERGHPLVLRWFPIHVLTDVPLVPDFLRLALHDLPSKPRHIVQRDVVVAGKAEP